jgi:hypothetical protein
MENKSYISRMTFAILNKDVDARDNMLLVVKHIHEFEMRVFNIKKAKYFDALFSEKLSSFKTIDRVWRKIQEMNPKLRGKEWEQRQAQAGLISYQIINDKYQLKLF